MSLKAFHIFFIVVSILLSLGLGWWNLSEYQLTENSSYLAWTIGSFVTGLGILIYLVSFIRKAKQIPA